MRRISDEEEKITLMMESSDIMQEGKYQNLPNQGDTQIHHEGIVLKETQMVVCLIPGRPNA